MPACAIGGKKSSVIYLKIRKGDFFKLVSQKLKKNLKYNLQKENEKYCYIST